MKHVTLFRVMLAVTTVVALVTLLSGNVLGAGLLMTSAATLVYGQVKLNQAKKMVDSSKAKMLL